MWRSRRARRSASPPSSRPWDRFAAHLLYGVTGSGKTEVYLRVIAAAIAAGRPGPGAGARNRLDAATGRSLPAPLQRRSGGRAFRPIRQLSGAIPGARRTAGARESSSGPVRRCSPPCRSSRSSWSTRSTTHRTSSTKAFAIRRVTLPWSEPAALACPLSWAQRRRRSKPWKTAAPGATRSTCCRSVRAARSAPRMTLVDLRKHAADQGIVDTGHAGDRAPPENRRPSHRVLEPPRLCTELCSAMPAAGSHLARTAMRA